MTELRSGNRAETASVRSVSSRLTFDVVDWRDMGGQVRAWDALALSASEPNPFLESWFLLPALAAFDPAGATRIARLMQGDELVGLMPLARSWRYYHLPLPNLASWTHANSFLGAPLVARGFESEFWEALLDHCNRQTGAALFLHLADLPLDGPLHRALVAVAVRRQCRLELVHREERAMLESALNSDAYFAQAVSTKKRKELRRQIHRLHDLGAAEFTRHRDTDGLDEWIADFLRLESAGWKGRAGSALACSPGTEGLFRESLAGAAARGRLERLTLTLDNQPIAMLATLLAPPGAFSFKTAFDERYARYSPGVLLQRENLAMLDDPDLAWTDSCAASDHPMIDHFWRERRPIGRISVAIGGAMRRAVFGRIVQAEIARSPAGLTP